VHVSGFPLANRREARKLGLLRRKRSLSSPHSGREEEAPRTLFVEGATQAPGICPQPNAREWSRWNGMSVFAGNARHRCSISCKSGFYDLSLEKLFDRFEKLWPYFSQRNRLFDKGRGVNHRYPLLEGGPVVTVNNTDWDPVAPLERLLEC
jgi:hypothetical protein